MSSIHILGARWEIEHAPRFADTQSPGFTRRRVTCRPFRAWFSYWPAFPWAPPRAGKPAAPSGLGPIAGGRLFVAQCPPRCGQGFSCVMFLTFPPMSSKRFLTV